MGIPTSKNGMVIKLQRRPTEVLLCDYDIDGADLKPAHTQWLANNIIVPFGKKNACDIHGPVSIIIEGRASRSGSDKHNLGLSQKRAMNVQQYLKSRLMDSQVKIYSYGKGESLSPYADHTEFAIDRAVRIQLCNAPRTTLPPPVIPTPAMKTFKLRVIQGDSVSGTIGPGKIGGGIQFEELTFQIWDVKESTTALYQYHNSGKTGGIGLGLPISPEKTLGGTGKWNEFQAPGFMNADSFGGPARLDGSVGLTIVASVVSTGRDFHFGGFEDGKWWAAPAFKFNIKDLDTGTSTAPSVGISFYDPGPVGSFNYLKNSLRTGYNGD